MSATDEDAPELVCRLLDLVCNAPVSLEGLLDIDCDRLTSDPLFNASALETLLLRNLGDAIGVMLSISTTKHVMATAASARTETESTFDAESVPVALTGAIALLAMKDVELSFQKAQTGRVN